MTLFAHRCWYCGHRMRDLDVLDTRYAGSPPSPYQCKDREACEERRVQADSKDSA